MRLCVGVPNQSLILGSMMIDEMAALERGLRTIIKYTNPPLSVFEKAAIKSLTDGLSEVLASGLYGKPPSDLKE